MSGFNAAVAGCFFALESVLRPSSSDSAPSLTTAMLLLSSVLASVISQAGLGSDPAFKIPAYDFRSPAGRLGLHFTREFCWDYDYTQKEVEYMMGVHIININLQCHLQ